MEVTRRKLLSLGVGLVAAPLVPAIAAPAALVAQGEYVPLQYGEAPDREYQNVWTPDRLNGDFTVEMWIHPKGPPVMQWKIPPELLDELQDRLAKTAAVRV